MDGERGIMCMACVNRKESLPVFTSQTQSISALRQVTVFHPTEDSRLSWPDWLVTHRDGIPISVLTGLSAE